jgi:hypothetical protein
VEWFRNLVECLGNRLTIHVASKDRRPIASVVTLQHRETLVYKYGCSEATYHSSGAMPFLFWKVIEDAKAAGLSTLDLGRSNSDNQGLITFKERWGAVPSILTYVSYSPSRDWHSQGRIPQLPKAFVARMPDWVLTTAGRLLYRYLG